MHAAGLGEAERLGPVLERSMSRSRNVGSSSPGGNRADDRDGAPELPKVVGTTVAFEQVDVESRPLVKIEGTIEVPP